MSKGKQEVVMMPVDVALSLAKERQAAHLAAIERDLSDLAAAGLAAPVSAADLALLEQNGLAYDPARGMAYDSARGMAYEVRDVIKG